jgi:hypothetical protein
LFIQVVGKLGINVKKINHTIFKYKIKFIIHIVSHAHIIIVKIVYTIVIILLVIIIESFHILVKQLVQLHFILIIVAIVTIELLLLIANNVCGVKFLSTLPHPKDNLIVLIISSFSASIMLFNG